MIQKIMKWFNKEHEGQAAQLPKNESAQFLLNIDDIQVGTLYCENGEWCFKYSEDFKEHPDYNRIVGFPDLNKTYKSEELWPFFQIRIPGLKQPAIREILEKEKIDKENEVELLKRFGKKTISNPYELVTV
ncbi:HipA N-terminal domain-containing protein [Compostibacter hankyongensis]|uniref:HipA N-terminal subdomain 1 domain-containing protein n=1 Tax=Compostibacter hankyongensis TaxID=1007089 RepID=A0ABP8GAV6_9BACT